MSEGGMDGQDRSGFADDATYLFDQASESECLRAYGIHNPIGGLPAFGNGKGGEVLDVDRLDSVAPSAEHTEHRKPTQRPCNVVDQDVFAAEQDCGPKDRMAEA